MDKRLKKLLKTQPIVNGAILDTYNQRVYINHSPTITTRVNASSNIYVVRKEKIMRIRKLVPVECLKLMGFTREDYQAMRDIGMTDAQIYHCAGDSLPVNVCAMIIGQTLPISEDKLRYIVEQYVEKEIVEK